FEHEIRNDEARPRPERTGKGHTSPKQTKRYTGNGRDALMPEAVCKKSTRDRAKHACDHSRPTGHLRIIVLLPTEPLNEEYRDDGREHSHAEPRGDCEQCAQVCRAD